MKPVECSLQVRYIIKLLYTILLALCIVFTQSEGQTDDLGPCYSLKSLMDVFNRPEYVNLPAVHALMEAYHNNCEMLIRKRPGIKTMLLVAVEGSKRRKRYIIANKLARAMKGIVMYNPPDGFERMRFSMNASMELKRAYHSLCLYATANNARQILYRSHVIISGYWFDQAAFVIAKKYHPNFPPPDSALWTWPKDLLIPDLTFYIDDANEETYDGRRPNVMEMKMRDVYQKWTFPKIIPISNGSNYNYVLREMLAHVDMYLHLNKNPS